MTSIAQAALLGMFLGMAAIAQGRGADDFEEPDGTLKEPLIMTEEQGGIAGPRVTIYEIKPDGTYKRRSYTRSVDKNGDEVKRGESTREGRLAREKLDEIAKALASQKFVDLPKQIGREAKVNPSTIVIDLGKKRTALSKAPKGQDEAEEVDDHRARFLAVAKAIKSPIEAGKK